MSIDQRLFFSKLSTTAQPNLRVVRHKGYLDEYLLALIKQMGVPTMSDHITSFNSRISNNMNTEQVEQIVKAIIAGKYSWACVLLLRFAGHNPMDYIPYRTYIRLLKNNCLGANSETKQADNKKNVDGYDVKRNWISF
jgi:hypothetical protein